MIFVWIFYRFVQLFHRSPVCGHSVFAATPSSLNSSAIPIAHMDMPYFAIVYAEKCVMINNIDCECHGNNINGGVGWFEICMSCNTRSGYRVYSCIHSFIISLIHLFAHLFIHSFIHSFIHLFVRLFVRSLVRSFVRLFVHSFIHSYNHSFFHLFIYSFIQPQCLLCESWKPTYFN